MTKILHVTEDHSTGNTGITSAVDSLIHQLLPFFQQEIACIGPEAVQVPNGADLHVLKSHGLWKSWRMAAGQRPLLRQLVAQADVIHLHGIWMWIQWAASQEAYSASKSVILTTHGMLEPWIWDCQSWPHRLKKSIYWDRVAQPTFRCAQIIHALTFSEAEHLRRYFPGNRIEVIPHGLDLSEVNGILSQVKEAQSAKSDYFLFVGRIHPVKGIDLLIQAFAQLPVNEFKLKIVGPVHASEKKYANKLVRMVESTGLQQRVEFLGPVQGIEKWRLYRHAWAFCLPSHSEVIGMVNLEAAASSTPVITTIESGVVADWGRRGGLLIHPNIDSISNALMQATGWSKAEREDRGASLRHLIEDTYSWRVITPRWMSLYKELCSQSHD